MAKFFVGQRVRILWSEGFPELAGEEGVIVEQAKDGGVQGDSDWVVAPRCWGTSYSPYIAKNGACRFGPSESQLEPILYDGAQQSEFGYSELMDNLRTKVQEEV